MDDYELQAVDFLKRSGTEMKIVFETVVDGFPNETGNRKLPHRKYKVTMTRDGKKFTTPFYGSYIDFRDHKDPDAYDILAALQKYEVDDNMWDFAKEFGYEINSEESYNAAKATWRACRDEYRRLLKFFGMAWMPELQEIN